MPFVTYDADKPANKITIVGNPTLGEVKTMIIGVRNLSGEEKSGEVWVNELRLLEYNNEGGWAARGKLNVQLSDFGTIDLNGSYITDGFGGIEQGVNERQQETTSDYTLTTNFDLGKFFPRQGTRLCTDLLQCAAHSKSPEVQSARYGYGTAGCTRRSGKPQ